MKVKKGGFSCAMENCKNISSRMPGLSFFRFPRDSERAQLWLRNCGCTIDNSIENLHNIYRVCKDHFEDTMFLNNLKNRLQPHAIPTATNANANISNNEITFSNSKDTDLTNPVTNEKIMNEVNQEIYECSQPDYKLDDKSDKETQTHNKLTSSSPRKQILKKKLLAYGSSYEDYNDNCKNKKIFKKIIRFP